MTYLRKACNFQFSVEFQSVVIENGGCGCEDLSASALEDAREQWEKEGQPFPATFCELDPCMVIPLCPAPMLYKCLLSARLRLFFLPSGKSKGISRS